MSYGVDSELAAQVLTDPIEWERTAQASVGLRSCRFGAELDPARRRLYIAASLSPGLDSNLAWKISLRVCKQLVDLDLGVRDRLHVPHTDDFRNGVSLLPLLLACAFGVERDYRLEARSVVGRSPVAWGYGSTKMSTPVRRLPRQGKQQRLL